MAMISRWRSMELLLAVTAMLFLSSMIQTNKCRAQTLSDTNSTAATLSAKSAATTSTPYTSTTDLPYLENIDCFTGDGYEYVGNRSHTTFGLTCQSWSMKDAQDANPTFSPGDPGPGDFCRNPKTNPDLKRVRPWCFTASGLSFWQYCDVPRCGETKSQLKPSGHCEQLTPASRQCNIAYGKGASVFIGDGTSLRGVSNLVQLLYTYSENAFFRQACLDLANHALCAIYMPKCDNDSLPLRLCREDCETLVSVCPLEWGQSISSSESLNDLNVVLPKCEELPSAHNPTGYDRCMLQNYVLNQTASCYRDSLPLDYSGTINTTVSGKPCLAWYDVPAFRPRRTNPLRYVFMLSDAGNNCRDLEARAQPWCVTAYSTDDDNNTRYTWEYCDVPKCGDSPTGEDDERNVALVVGIIVPCSIVGSLAVFLLAHCVFVSKRKQRVYPCDSCTDLAGNRDEDRRKLFPQSAVPAKQSEWMMSKSRTREGRRSIDATSMHHLKPMQRSSSISELAKNSVLQLGALPALLSQSARFEDLAKDEERQLKMAALSEELRHRDVTAHSLSIQTMLGEGEFSRVFCAALKERENDAPQTVALKCAKDAYLKDSVIALLEEAVRMSELHHPHVMWMEGICLESGLSLGTADARMADSSSNGDSPIAAATSNHVPLAVLNDLQKSPLLLLPLMELGDLGSLLKASRSNPSHFPTWLTNHRLITMVKEIADGMTYLAEQNCVHRDLAARNCLVRKDYTVVIADFGLSRAMDDGSYYRQQNTTRLPVKWLAPECLHDRVFTRRSDVWAFGVTTWEVFSLGRIPYPGISNFAIPGYLNSGGRLDKPSLCPTEIHALVEECWNMNPAERPLMSSLLQSVTKILLNYGADTEAGLRLGPTGVSVDEYVEMQPLSEDEL